MEHAADELTDVRLVEPPIVEKEFALAIGRNEATPVFRFDGKYSGGTENDMVEIAEWSRYVMDDPKVVRESVQH